MRIVILYFISFSLNALKKQSASTQYFNDLLRLISKRNWSCFFKASVSSSFLTKFHLADSRQNPVCRVYVSAEYCFYSFNKRSLFLLNILFCSSKLSHLVTSYSSQARVSIVSCFYFFFYLLFVILKLRYRWTFGLDYPQKKHIQAFMTCVLKLNA